MPDETPDGELDGLDFQAVDFQAAVSQHGGDTVPASPADRGRSATEDVPARAVPERRHGLRRRLVSGGVLLAALVGMGGAYSAFAGASGAADSAASEAQVTQGRQLFNVSCITCHGVNLQGVQNRGPSLIGTGGAATYFQVATGRMPVNAQGAYIQSHGQRYTQAQIDALVAYVQSVGGGPMKPTDTNLRDNKNLGAGGDLFRLNCASCHGFSGKGAPLSAGKVVPSLNKSTDVEMYTAMLSGPESMPVFSDNQLTPQQKRELIGYVQSMKASNDPGGHGLDRVGPVTEGIVIWVVGIGAIVVVILWIGAKA